MILHLKKIDGEQHGLVNGVGGQKDGDNTGDNIFGLVGSSKGGKALIGGPTPSRFPY
jgi:hypothetical protein